MKNWLMLTLVGKDQPGIVAEVSRVLFDMQWKFRRSIDDPSWR